MRVAQQESPKLTFKLIQFGDLAAAESSQLLRSLEIAMCSSPCSIEHRISLGSKQHEVRSLGTVREVGGNRELPIRPGGVYIVAGGAGGVGSKLSAALLQQGARVAVLGRSPTYGDHETGLRERKRDACLEYCSADITDVSAVKAALAVIRTKYGPVRGLFHCAGEPGGGLILFKSVRDAHKVFSAKLRGTVCLNEATQSDPLDHFVLFSSLLLPR